MRIASVLIALLPLSACGDKTTAFTDAAVADAATVDAATIDSGEGGAPVDAASIDARVDATVDATVDASLDAANAAFDASFDALVDAKVDATEFDARPPPVVEVDCAGAKIAITVTVDSTPQYVYDPKTQMISVDEIVAFKMPRSHNAVSGLPPTTDGRFLVDFSETKCLRFTAGGFYPFFCGPHRFTGSIAVVVH